MPWVVWNVCALKDLRIKAKTLACECEFKSEQMADLPVSEKMLGGAA